MSKTKRRKLEALLDKLDKIEAGLVDILEPSNVEEREAMQALATASDLLASIMDRVVQEDLVTTAKLEKKKGTKTE
jgi:hypothetical protein